MKCELQYTDTLIRSCPFSAYTEAYTVCSLAVGPPGGSSGEARGGTAEEEDQGRTSEEDEEGGEDNTYGRQVRLQNL